MECRNEDCRNDDNRKFTFDTDLDTGKPKRECDICGDITKK
jgi:hypothetical protein